MTKRRTGNLVIVPFVSVTNTDVNIIDEVKRILDKIDVGYKESWVIDENNPQHKKRCNIRIDKFARVKGFINLIEPFLQSTKKHNAEVVQHFIQHREENLFSRNSKGHIVRNKYPKELVCEIASIRKHARAIPLEEMLKAPNVA